MSSIVTRMMLSNKCCNHAHFMPCLIICNCYWFIFSFDSWKQSNMNSVWTIIEKSLHNNIFHSQIRNGFYSIAVWNCASGFFILDNLIKKLNKLEYPMKTLGLNYWSTFFYCFSFTILMFKSFYKKIFLIKVWIKCWTEK